MDFCQLIRSVRLFKSWKKEFDLLLVKIIYPLIRGVHFLDCPLIKKSIGKRFTYPGPIIRSSPLSVLIFWYIIIEFIRANQKKTSSFLNFFFK